MKKGIAASPGIAIGKVLCVENQAIVIEKHTITDVDAELEKLSECIDRSKKELEAIQEKTRNEVGEEEAAIFGAHIMVLEDPELSSAATDKIKTEKVNADYAFNEITNQFIAVFESMDNEYMRERAADIKDVSNRVLGHLLGCVKKDLSHLDEDVIIVTHDLTPSDTASMDKKKVIGFLTNVGGKTSHTAIMARTLDIPAIVGLSDITDYVKTGDTIILDGTKGEVIIQPDEHDLSSYDKLKQQYNAEKEHLKALIGLPTITTDDHKVELAANIGSDEDLDAVLSHDAEGVGLFRTEFLYMNRSSLPTEDEQFEAYKKVASSLKGKPVVIRTLDIGGDKEVSYLKLEKEMNPFLGYRAIRMCLNGNVKLSKDFMGKDIFKTQLRAILRASAYGNIKIMFPMISSIQELKDAKQLLEASKKELDREQINYNKAIEVGMMIEVPSAAVISDLLAKHVDFFSIGTNDLIQYTCAVDRMNEKISHLYEPYHPGVLRLIKMVIENAHQAGIWVGMCGGMAEDQMMIPILLGFGLDEFSMSAASLLRSRQLIRSLNKSEMEKHSQKVVTLEGADDIKKYLVDLEV